jgi:two-component system, cell cycle sensor histidine kinase and response regulator CckA
VKGIDMANGMSLASAWGIVHNHGGFMEAANHPDGGKTFNVHLPANKIETYDQLMPENEISATILVVDDDEMALEVMSEMLRLLGYRVITAERGNKALDIYKKKMTWIDLVLLDIMMPEMTGDIVFQQLRTMDPDVKVICASGYCAPETVEKMLSAGCYGYFPKPVNLTELSRHVRRVLTKK